MDTKFSAILAFVNDLNFYGHLFKPLRLYTLYLSKIQPENAKAIEQQVGIFREYCVRHRDDILNKANMDVIKFNDKIYIDLGAILIKADLTNTTLIWRHLECLSVLLDDETKCKEVLKNSTTPENEFIDNMMTKLDGVDVNTLMSNPNMIQSLISGTDHSNLDVNKLLGTVKGMITNMSNTASDPQTKESMSMLLNMTDMLGKMSSSDEFDPTQMMGQMTEMMSKLKS